MITERTFLLSEITTLEALLAKIPEEDVIDRMSLEGRLQEVKQALAALPPEEALPKKAVLTFRGKPVIGTHGISADFGSKAAGAFSDAFAAFAASLSEGLRSMGPIPDKERNQLLITGTAVGSFGFEFELPQPEAAAQASMFAEPDRALQALEKLESLFRLAADGSDEDLATIVEEVAPRAVKKAHEFLDLLSQQHAWCQLQFQDTAFRFRNYEQLKAASERLKADNIQEELQTMHGMFRGVMPEGRTFEFRQQGHKESIRGKIDNTVTDPDVLVAQWMLKPVTVTFKSTRVGQGKPRYSLLSLDHIRLQDAN